MSAAMNDDAWGREPWLAERVLYGARQVGGGVAIADAQALVITVAADFRVCGVVAGERRTRFASELGQAVLHAQEPDEAAALDVLRRRHGQLSIAQVLCEEGVVELHRAVCLLRGTKAPPLTAMQVAIGASRARASECSRAMSLFCGLLGDAAGRAALTVGAAGGVYIAGGLVPLLGDWFARSPFRRRFDGAARLADTLRAIPTFVMPGQALSLAGTGGEGDLVGHDTSTPSLARRAGTVSPQR